MAILRPITEAQVEISLYRDDGEMYYRAAFISSSPFGAKLEGLKVIYDPIVVHSFFDPVYYKDLLNYFTDSLESTVGSTDSFTLEISIRGCGTGSMEFGRFRATGCKLIGYSLPKFNRESGEAAQFSLTFQPSGVSKLLT